MSEGGAELDLKLLRKERMARQAELAKKIASSPAKRTQRQIEEDMIEERRKRKGF